MPTFAESGFADFDSLQWYGIVGPANMPPPVTARLNAEINRALASPALRARFSGEAIDPMPMTPGQFAAYVRAEIARWTTVARERRIRMED